MVDYLSRLSGFTDKGILYRFNDEAMVLSEKLMKEDFKSNWPTKTFNIKGVPFKIKLKVKYSGYQDRKIGDIYCTFDVGKGKWAEYNSIDLMNEMVESTLLGGKEK